VLYHGRRHPRDMGAEEVRAFLGHLAGNLQVAASTHQQALSALLFLYRQRNVLPVVENGKLLGIVSVWDVLARIGRVK